MPDMEIPPKLLPLLEKDKRYKIVIGGRGSGKSFTFADLCLMGSQVNGLKIGCFREFQSSIEDSVHSLLADEIDRLKLSGFSILKNEITNIYGGEFKFRGLARNADSIKSMNGFKRFWIEEGQTISAESLKLLTPTLRTDDSEIWISANPMSSADPFSQRFIIPFERELERDGYYEDDLHLIIVCNYMDNPRFPDVLEQERLFDKEFLSKAEYEHIWLGKFNDEVEGSIIPVDWFDAAVDSHIALGFEPEGVKIVTHDPSDVGNDPKGLSYSVGSVVLDVVENTKGDVNEGADWATEYAIDVGADEFRWDCDGLGITLKRQISESLSDTGIDIVMFRGSNIPDNPDQIYHQDENISRKIVKTNRQTFKNKRAQYYFSLRDRFYATFKAIKKGILATSVDHYISLSSGIKNMARLRSEVCRIPRRKNSNGLLQIMTKDEMLRIHKIKSPNMADSLMMAETPDSTSGIDGGYYSKILKKLRLTGRIGDVPYDPALQVHTFWSIGEDDSVCIWFVQIRGANKRLIDYYQNSGESLAHYANVIRNREYLLGKHYVPDSVKNQSVTQIGKNTYDAISNIGLKPVIRVTRAKNQEELQSGIMTTRNFLAQCMIDESRCEEGIACLENYRKEWDEKNAVHKRTPLDDWAARGANALRVGVMGQSSGGGLTQTQLIPAQTSDY